MVDIHELKWSWLVIWSLITGPTEYHRWSDREEINVKNLGLVLLMCLVREKLNNFKEMGFVLRGLLTLSNTVFPQLS